MSTRGIGDSARCIHGTSFCQIGNCFSGATMGAAICQPKSVRISPRSVKSFKVIGVPCAKCRRSQNGFSYFFQAARIGQTTVVPGRCPAIYFSHFPKLLCRMASAINSAKGWRRSGPAVWDKLKLIDAQGHEVAVIALELGNLAFRSFGATDAGPRRGVR